MRTTVSKPTTGTYTNSATTASTAKAFYTSAAGTRQYIGSTHASFVNFPLPAALASKVILEAYITVPATEHAGDRTMKLVRHARPKTAYSKMTAGNDPGALAGAVELSVTQDSSVDSDFVFDVIDDLDAIKGGSPYYGWRITSTYGSAWGIYGWKTSRAMTLTVVYTDAAEAPVGLGPHGYTDLAAPTLTWTAPEDLLSARAQVAVAPLDPDDDPDWGTLLFDSGTVDLTVGQLSLAAVGWAGMADGEEVAVRLLQTSLGGESDWSEPIIMSRVVRDTFTLTSPVGTTTDPSPVAVWTYAGQASYQVIYRSGGKVIYNTGVVAGSDQSFTLPRGGATRAGQAIEIEGRGWPELVYTPSPGDPGYSSDTVTTIYNTGAGAAVTGLYGTQDGRAPWVDYTWLTPGGVPDEWQYERDGEIIARFDAADEDGAVLTYRDWAFPPNTDCEVVIRPINAGVVGNAPAPIVVRTRVTGAWLFEPVEGGPYFWAKVGDDLAPAYSESSVWYVPVGGDREIKRTFALRGQTADLAGRLTTDGGDPRPIYEQMADVWAIKSRPTASLRCAWGDQNIPVIASDIDPQMSNVLSSTKRIAKAVRYHIVQDGELPFEPDAP